MSALEIGGVTMFGTEWVQLYAMLTILAASIMLNKWWIRRYVATYSVSTSTGLLGMLAISVVTLWAGICVVLHSMQILSQ